MLKSNLDDRKNEVASYIVIAISMLAAAAFIYQEFFQLGRSFPGDLGDARFNIFVLEHVYRYLTGQEASLLSPGIFYPYPYTLGFSDTHAGSFLIYALFRLVGLNEYLSFSAWIAVGYLGTFLVAYLVLLRFSVGPIIAVVGAFAFAFSLTAVAQLGHAQLVYRLGTPLAILFIYRFSQTFSPDDLFKAIAAIALQILLNVYNGFYTVLLCGVLLVVALLYSGFTRDGGFLRMASGVRDAWLARANYRAGTIAVMLFLTVATVTVLGFHLYVSHLYGLGRHWSGIETQVPRPQSYFVMDRLPYWSTISEAISGLKSRNEQQLFFGIPLTVLAIAMLDYLLWRRRECSSELKILVLTVIASVLLVTSFGGYTLYWFVAQLPGYDALRAVARYQLILQFPLIVAVGLYLSHLLRSAALRSVGIVMLLVWAVWSPLDVAWLSKHRVQIEEASTRIETASDIISSKSYGPRSVLAYGADYEDQPWIIQLDAMLLAQKNGIATFNGYSGNFPPGAVLRPSCAGFVQQLSEYDHWAGRRGMPRLSELDIEPVLVGTSSCSLNLDDILAIAETQEPIDYTRGETLSKAGAASVKLQIAGVSVENAQYRIDLQVVNQSDETIHAQTAAPFRLSWRAVRPGDRSRQGWNTRFDIRGDVSPGGSLPHTLFVPKSDVAQGEVIQVTFVVEHQFWAHDIGVSPVEIVPPN